MCFEDLSCCSHMEELNSFTIIAPCKQLVEKKNYLVRNTETVMMSKQVVLSDSEKKKKSNPDKHEINKLAVYPRHFLTVLFPSFL